jgi:hypothetical protein
MPFIVPRPAIRYDERNETEFRTALDLYLRALVVPPFGITIIAPINANSVVTAVPAALTEWQGNTRWRTEIDLRDYQTMELVTYVMGTGSAGSELRYQYTADLTGTAGWDYVDGTTGPNVTLHTLGSQRSQVIITPAARGRVLIRPVTIGGDGVTNASVGVMRVVFR